MLMRMPELARLNVTMLHCLLDVRAEGSTLLATHEHEPAATEAVAAEADEPRDECAAREACGSGRALSPQLARGGLRLQRLRWLDGLRRAFLELVPLLHPPREQPLWHPRRREFELWELREWGELGQ